MAAIILRQFRAINVAAQKRQADIGGAEDDGGGRENFDNAIDGVLHRTGGVAVGAGRRRGAGGEGIGPNPIRPINPVAGHAEAAR